MTKEVLRSKSLRKSNSVNLDFSSFSRNEPEWFQQFTGVPLSPSVNLDHLGLHPSLPIPLWKGNLKIRYPNLGGCFSKFDYSEI